MPPPPRDRGEEHVMVQAGKWTIRRPDEIRSAGHVGRWAVVVGEGEDRRPGARTRLRETLEGIGRVIPPERTLVVGLPGHARDQASHVDEEGGPHVLDEPDDRGTGAAGLLAALGIEAREARAPGGGAPRGSMSRMSGGRGPPCSSPPCGSRRGSPGQRWCSFLRIASSGRKG